LESYETRIADIHLLLGDEISLKELTGICMGMLTTEFNEFEDIVMIASETQNEALFHDIIEDVTNRH
jgi:hypothetical protein